MQSSRDAPAFEVTLLDYYGSVSSTSKGACIASGEEKKIQKNKSASLKAAHDPVICCAGKPAPSAAASAALVTVQRCPSPCSQLNDGSAELQGERGDGAARRDQL